MTRALLRHALRVVAVALCATALFVLPARTVVVSEVAVGRALMLAGPTGEMQRRTVRSAFEGAREATIERVRFSPRRDGPRFWRRAGTRRSLRVLASRPAVSGWCERCPLVALFARRDEPRATADAPSSPDASRDAHASPRAPPAIA